jgi:hypothetical protein
LAKYCKSHSRELQSGRIVVYGLLKIAQSKRAFGELDFGLDGWLLGLGLGFGLDLDRYGFVLGLGDGSVYKSLTRVIIN